VLEEDDGSFSYDSNMFDAREAAVAAGPLDGADHAAQDAVFDLDESPSGFDQEEPAAMGIESPYADLAAEPAPALRVGTPGGGGRWVWVLVWVLHGPHSLTSCRSADLQ
jgi:hypothetical protein